MIRRLLERRRFMREHRWTHAHLSDYLDADLDRAERRRVEQHLGLCPQCRRVLATLRRTLRGLRDLGAPPRPEVANGVIERLRDQD
jgi:anti-sigma factor RsiW